MSAPAFKQARISDDLTLAYVDSWHARAKEDLPERYKTVVGLHGVGFNSAVWTPLLPALPSSIRFLAYNQRSYAQSSPAFNAKQPGGTDATATYLCDLMEFLRFAVEELGVQGMDEQTHEGGIVLLGWSKGTVLCFSLLSLIHLASSPSPTSFLTHLPTSGLPHTSLLRTHIRSLILFEPPGSALGRPPTSDYTTAMKAVSPPNSSTPTEFAEAFAGWIGMYAHSADPDEVAEELLPPSGLDALAPSLRQVAWEPACVAHGFSWRLAEGAEEVQRLAESALKPTGGVALPVGLIYGTRTNGYCLDAAKTVEGWWGLSAGAEEDRKERAKRKTAVRKVPGTNHFAFIHEPEAFANAVVELVDELSL
ncbi:hypothetical protein Rt10032_c01g0600 [Rhodotorula toruloides]|uniref:Uncharacterized protein n=1 Tax=Rhodotorula toruloides TaxID=5286 RepID=A0A511K8A5_RHOTO|nr:hypothetical protein Rt10032_c01g0600 [Rhodotorula toruloides]